MSDSNKPTQITREDIDKAIDSILNYEMKKFICFGCNKEYFPNYSHMECDECLFARWPKEVREAFFRGFFE